MVIPVEMPRGEAMAQSNDERAPLFGKGSQEGPPAPKHISVFFAMACIIDQFGVNPIIVLPKGIIFCGWVGYPLALFVFCLTIYTAILLGKCWVIAEYLDSSMILKSRYAYSALTEVAWGKNVGKVINILINISVFSSNIPALLIASQNLQFFDAKISNYAFNFSYCYWLIILGVALCPLTWLGSPKDTKWISVFSAVSVFTCALLTWFCMMSDETRVYTYDPIPPPNWLGVSVAFGILTFQFGCHPAILTIQTDMRFKTKLSKSIFLSFLATGTLSLLTIWLSSVLYGSGTHANLTQGLPTTTILYFDILLVTLQLFLSTIVGQCTLFQDIEDKLGISQELCWQRCFVRSSIVIFVIIFAEVLPRFDLVMGIIGGLLTGPISLIFPPLLYLRFRKLLHKKNTQRKIVKAVRKETEISNDNKFVVNVESQKEAIFAPERTFKTQNDLFKKKYFLKRLFSHATTEVNFKSGQLSIVEIIILFFVVGVGIVQTTTATYYSTKEAIQSTKFLPPCIFDVGAASEIINA